MDILELLLDFEAHQAELGDDAVAFTPDGQAALEAFRIYIEEEQEALAWARNVGRLEAEALAEAAAMEEERQAVS